MDKKLLLIFFGIFLIGIISAADTSFCCERLNSGAWCQNAPLSECDPAYNKTPTSCDATSYCRLGTCINSKEGDCMPNTPNRVCEINKGFWTSAGKDDLPQCQLGCCLIGNQAAFVTQVRCKKLSSIYGLEVNYRTDIQTERECISSATPEVEGACVMEQEDGERDCKRLTKKECQDLQAASNKTEFHQGFLCSAETLNTICGKSQKTSCVDGKEEVYYLDTCGNIANVYFSAKIDDDAYWTYIVTDPTQICGYGTSNVDSTVCGNCDYYQGSTCKKGNAQYGNYKCADLGCYEGSTKIAEHGETWCVNSPADASSGTKAPGGRDFRKVCYNGDVTVEACADYRQEVCLQSGIITPLGYNFKTAACRVNMWQDCVAQDNEKDCNNLDKRDCLWIPTASKEVVNTESNKTETVEGICVPNKAPGFNYWENSTDADTICDQASDTCIVEYTAGMAEGAAFSLLTKANHSWRVMGNADCVEKCRKTQCQFDKLLPSCDVKCSKQCLPLSCVDEKGEINADWQDEKQKICVNLGDCGVKNNYVGEIGYFDNWEEFYVREERTMNESGDTGMMGGLSQMSGLFGMFK